MTHVSEIVKPVDVNSGDFNFVTRPRCVNQVIEHIYLFLAGNTAWGHSTRCFLHRQFLVVPVECGLLVKCVRARSVARDTHAEVLASILLRMVESGSLEITADTSEVHLLELREDAGSFGHNTAELDQGV